MFLSNPGKHHAANTTQNPLKDRHYEAKTENTASPFQEFPHLHNLHLNNPLIPNITRHRLFPISLSLSLA